MGFPRRRTGTEHRAKTTRSVCTVVYREGEREGVRDVQRESQRERQRERVRERESETER